MNRFRHRFVPEVLSLPRKLGKTAQYHLYQTACGLRGLYWSLSRPLLRRPVFIVGCSRGGTTLVYKVFSQAVELGSLNRETHDFWAGLHPLAEREWRSHVLSGADAREQDRCEVSRYFYVHTGKQRVVDKNNQNGFGVEYLKALFPDAYFVFVKRNPGDNVNSLIEGWTRPDEFGTWSKDLPATVAIDEGRFVRWCFFLPEGWREYLTAPIEEVCAYQYSTMNAAIIKARQRIPEGQWIEIRYEDLLDEPTRVFADAFARCGLSFRPSVRERCKRTADVAYNAFSEIGVGKWRHSENKYRIERVLPFVSDVATAMGYTV